MKFEKTCKIVGIICILLAGLAGIASATTITIGGGPIASVGDQIDLPVTLDSAPTGLSFFQMTVASTDPSVANIVKVTYPPWATLNSTGSLPAGTVELIALDLGNANPPGASNIPLATITVKGLKAGSTQLTVTSNKLSDSVFYESPAGAVVPGSILVQGTIPTTTTTTTTTTTIVPTVTTTTVVPTTTTTTVVPTTPTPVPTMPVPIGPTGQVYFSTTPQGAAIFIDGARTNAVTPFIIAVPVGTHQVVFKLAGYNDLEAGFTAQQSSMATVSRRLSPGASVIPTTRVTTAVTTVPRTTITQIITTVPTTVPTVVPTVVPTNGPYDWLYKLTVPSWFKPYYPF